MTGKVFGDPENPLLVSVRSGGAISMPGMMISFLNVGINESIVERTDKKDLKTLVCLGLLPSFSYSAGGCHTAWRGTSSTTS